jgi:hypothetical protein
MNISSQFELKLLLKKLNFILPQASLINENKRSRAQMKPASAERKTEKKLFIKMYCTEQSFKVVALPFVAAVHLVSRAFAGRESEKRQWR